MDSNGRHVTLIIARLHREHKESIYDLPLNITIMKQTRSTSRPQHQIMDAARQVTQSRESACLFLKSAGIMTAKGNLSPKYK